MREILFRGKTSVGEWICGHLLEQNIPECHSYIVMSIIAELDNRHIEIMDFDINEVIPETVGQYTGLTDKNGVRIFEGDICRFKRYNDIYNGKIVFNVKTASFIMWYQSIVGAYSEKATHKMLLSVCNDIEVIGNIHDNTELLENSSL